RRCRFGLPLLLATVLPLIFPLSLHDALPIYFMPWCSGAEVQWRNDEGMQATLRISFAGLRQSFTTRNEHDFPNSIVIHLVDGPLDRKSTRLNSSHVKISYAVFCLKKKKAVSQ